MARPSLKGNVRKPEAEKAAQVAKKLVIETNIDPDDEMFFETVSFNLPSDLVELVRDLADARVKSARKKQRQAKRRGEKGPEARRSASAVVREALEAHKKKIEAEMQALQGHV